MEQDSESFDNTVKFYSAKSVHCYVCAIIIMCLNVLCVICIKKLNYADKCALEKFSLGTDSELFSDSIREGLVPVGVYCFAIGAGFCQWCYS